MIISFNFVTMAVLFLVFALLAYLIGARDLAGVSMNIATLLIGIVLAVILAAMLSSLSGIDLNPF